MIIKFSKNIEIFDWDSMGDYHYRRLWGIPNFPIVKLQPIIGDEFPTGDWYVHFYYPLHYLHNYFPEKIFGSIDCVKQQVDNFLIKMSGLLVFV